MEESCALGVYSVYSKYLVVSWSFNNRNYAISSNSIKVSFFSECFQTREPRSRSSAACKWPSATFRQRVDMNMTWTNVRGMWIDNLWYWWLMQCTLLIFLTGTATVADISALNASLLKPDIKSVSHSASWLSSLLSMLGVMMLRIAFTFLCLTAAEPCSEFDPFCAAKGHELLQRQKLLKMERWAIEASVKDSYATGQKRLKRSELLVEKDFASFHHSAYRAFMKDESCMENVQKGIHHFDPFWQDHRSGWWAQLHRAPGSHGACDGGDGDLLQARPHWEHYRSWCSIRTVHEGLCWNADSWKTPYDLSVDGAVGGKFGGQLHFWLPRLVVELLHAGLAWSNWPRNWEYLPWFVADANSELHREDEASQLTSHLRFSYCVACLWWSDWPHPQPRNPGGVHVFICFSLTPRPMQSTPFLFNVYSPPVRVSYVFSTVFACFPWTPLSKSTSLLTQWTPFFFSLIPAGTCGSCWAFGSLLRWSQVDKSI